jgi:hypothetical protein
VQDEAIVGRRPSLRWGEKSVQFSKAKIRLQSFFILMTNQPSFSSRALVAGFGVFEHLPRVCRMPRFVVPPGDLLFVG